MKQRLSTMFRLFSVLLFLPCLASMGFGDGVGTSPSFRGPVGLQIYSLRNQLKKDGAAALDYVKQQGFKEVEIGLESHYGMTQEAMRDALKERGLTPIAAHAGQNFLLKETDKAIAAAKFFGLKYVGVAWASHKAPMDEAQTLKIADDFNTIGKRLKEHGIQFFYHNHGFEFQPYKDGETLFDLLMQKTDPDLVKYEMDVLWTIFPGQDPAALLKKYPDRWVLMHLKDLAKGVQGNLSGGTDTKNDVALGSGQVDYAAVLKAAQEIGIKHYFIEDESEAVLTQIPESLKFLSTIKFSQDNVSTGPEKKNPADRDFVSLMTGKDGNRWAENAKPLAGWVKCGGDSTFAVEGDTIVGKSGPGANTYLCTEKKYSNFVFKFDVKYDVDCNSGVQFRSAFQSKDGKDVMSGYQCEILPENDTANVYDEHRRNRYLLPQTPELQAKINKAFKKGDWNEIVIQCVGPSIKTWLNGVKIADLSDLVEQEGIFGLQVHSGDQGQIRWRNISIKELPATPWIMLYADKKFGPVEQKPVGKWEVQDDGSVKGTTEEGQPKDGMLLSKDSYKNFAVKVSFKKIAGNSGLYFRATDVDKPYWLKGFQCEIEAGKVCSGLWEVEGRGWVAKNEELAAKEYKADDWNDVGTVAVGDHLTTFLNGWTVVDINDPKCAKEGKTGLQLHGGGNQGYMFRDYYIMPLDAEAVKLIER